MTHSHRPNDFVDCTDTVPVPDLQPTLPTKDDGVLSGSDPAALKEQLEKAGFKVGSHALAPVRRAPRNPPPRGKTPAP